LDLVAALLLIGLGQGLLLAGLLVVRRDLRRASTLFLATLIGAVTLSGLEDAALRFGWLDQAPAVAGAGLLLIPLIGPCLRGHVAAIFNPAWRLQRRDWPWITATVTAGLAALLFLIQPAPTRLAILSDRAGASDPGVVTAALSLVTVHLLSAMLIAAALVLSLREVRFRSRDLRPGDPLAGRLVWLRGLLVLIGVSWLAYLCSLVAGLMPGIDTAPFDALAGVVQVAALYALGLLGLAQPDRMLPPPGEMLAAILAPTRPKYGRAALPEADRSELAATITRVMEQDRLYRDPLLNLSRLAEAVGASPNDVSQTLNTAFGIGYHDYVARLRVAAAQEILRDPARQDSLMDVLLEAGFNSKSVFNAAFKRETGMTPSAYRASVRQPSDAPPPGGCPTP